MIARRLLAAAGLCATLAAHAQSAVQVFGTLDLAARRVRNDGQTVDQLASNGFSPDHLGVRGSEDLGSGLAATFWLEAAIFPDTGTADAARFFGRRATVSLVGTRWGELRLGRDQAPAYRNLAVFEPYGNLGVASALNLISTLGSGAQTLIRTDNAVAWLWSATPNCANAYRECGFYLNASRAAGEGLAGTGYTSARVGWNGGPFHASVAGASTRTGTPDRFRVWNAGASYDFGALKLLGLYHRSAWGARRQSVYNLGVAVPAGLFVIRANVERADASGDGTDANDARLYGLGASYALSLRTLLYATAGRIRNAGQAAYAVASLPPPVAGKRSTGYDLGLRHAF